MVYEVDIVICDVALLKDRLLLEWSFTWRRYLESYSIRYRSQCQSEAQMFWQRLLQKDGLDDSGALRKISTLEVIASDIHRIIVGYGVDPFGR
ncbi:unnamed protein product [Hymenolepis diminuta]|nr:unnamed protein product [Hymenolepis diminuta]